MVGDDNVKLPESQVELDTDYYAINLWIRREVGLLWNGRFKLLPGVAIGLGEGSLGIPNTPPGEEEERVGTVVIGSGIQYSVGLALQFEILSYTTRTGTRGEFVIAFDYAYRYAKFDDISFINQSIPMSEVFRDQNFEIDLSGHLITISVGIGGVPTW